jgi:hypothetical protein
VPTPPAFSSVPSTSHSTSRSRSRRPDMTPTGHIVDSGET